MNVHAETQIKIEFANGMEFTPTIVFEGAELECIPLGLLITF